VAEADELVYKRLRMMHGVPEGRTDMTDAIPLECGLEYFNGISFNKGCYVGQELMARVHYKGVVRKSLVSLAVVPSSTTADSDDGWLQATPPSDDSLFPIDWRIESDDRVPTLPSGAELTAPDGTKAGKLVSQCGALAFGLLRLEQLHASNGRAMTVTMTTPTTTAGTDASTSPTIVRLRPIMPSWWSRLQVPQ